MDHGGGPGAAAADGAPTVVRIAPRGLVGRLYRPTAEGARAHPARGDAAVLLLHGLGLVQDALLPEVAGALAAAGVAALTFDYRGWGESEGSPRQLFSVGEQMADAHAALAWLRAPGGGGFGRVALWGYSYGGGHAVRLAAADGGVAAVAVRAPFLLGARYVGWLLVRDPCHLLPVIGRGALDALAGPARGRPVYVPLAGRRGSGAPFVRPGEGDDCLTLCAGARGFEDRVAPRAFLRTWLHIRPFVAAVRLRCPLGVTYGAADRVARPWVARWLRWAARGEALLAPPPVGHFGMALGEAGRAATAAEADWLAARLGR